MSILTHHRGKKNVALLFSFLVLLIGIPALQAKSLKQSTVKGLLVIRLNNGEYAGGASQMNATVVKGKGPFKLRFNQDVGPLMKGATNEVTKFMNVRHGKKIPAKSQIELSFADRHTPKDGPSAAVACALMAESIVTGEKLDPGFAATGDMTATGEVRPVGAVPSKIKGAIRKECTHVGIPYQNVRSIEDSYILDGIESLYKIQIFSLNTFKDAREIAVLNRSENLQMAMDEFKEVQRVLERDEKYAMNGKVREKLKKVIDLAPNHISAQLLYLHSMKRAPKKLSLQGSLTGIDNAGLELSSILRDGSFLKGKGLQEDVLTELLFDINKLRPKLDERTKDYADSYKALASFFKHHRGRSSLTDELVLDLEKRAAQISTEKAKLLNDEEIASELFVE